LDTTAARPQPPRRGGARLQVCASCHVKASTLPCLYCAAPICAWCGLPRQRGMWPHRITSALHGCTKDAYEMWRAAADLGPLPPPSAVPLEANNVVDGGHLRR